jgi:dihydroorotase
METLTLPRPLDAHLHLRDGAVMRVAVGHSAAQFSSAVVMPNLRPPVTTVARAKTYGQRILAALPAGSDFRPLMTLYLTEQTPPAEIDRAAASGIIKGVKLYPAGATTHSNFGVHRLERTYSTLERMAQRGLPLLIHGEVTDPEIDIFDREAVFIERVLAPLQRRFPTLPMVLEHVTTREGVAFVRAAPSHVGATITPQHLLFNRNALFEGGLRPHRYCLPVLKSEPHRSAVLEAATGGEPSFFLGTDSAPHPRHSKETGCGCAGVYSAHAAMAFYAEIFQAAGALEALPRFAFHNGAAFYGLAPAATLELRREDWRIPRTYPLGGGRKLVPLAAGEVLHWAFKSR